MPTSLRVIACPKCGSKTPKVTPLSEDHFFCESCQHAWEHTPAHLPQAISPSGQSDRRTSDRRLPTRLVAPECRNCTAVGGMAVETRTERFVYYRCPACNDLFALRKPASRIELPPSTDIHPESYRLREPAGDTPGSTGTPAHAPLRVVELWRLRKGDRELLCIACQLPTGVNLRLIEGAEFRRSELFQGAPQMVRCAELWRSKLTDRGWG